MSPEVSVIGVRGEHTTTISVIALQWLVDNQFEPPYTMYQITLADAHAAEEMEKMVNTYGPLKMDPAEDP